MAFDCDIVVVGGGPGGSTASAWLARAVRHVVLLERDRFPRFHIGESLLASVNQVLDAIGAAGLVRDAGFPQKWGATLMTSDASVERFADFAAARHVPRPQTWQVPRERFDEILLRHAARCGADVREQHRVTDLSFDAGGVTVSFVHTARDRLASASGAPPASEGATRPTASLRARAVIDASGRAALLGQRFALRINEPDLANVALFSHFSGVPRAGGRRAGDIRVIARADPGWFWLIPISGDLMSVGVVLPRAAFKPLSRLEPEALLAQLIAGTPAVAGLMTGARRRWPVRVERDFSYAARTYAGDRWVVVGDAGSFLDPVFSSGVAIAMESGLEGAQAVDAGLAAGDLSSRAFRTFERRQHGRYRSFRRFVRGFYTPAFRDLILSPDHDPPPALFRALLTVLAGYWRPPPGTRFRIAVFFLLVRLWARFGPVPQHGIRATPDPTTDTAVAASDAGRPSRGPPPSRSARASPSACGVRGQISIFDTAAVSTIEIRPLVGRRRHDARRAMIDARRPATEHPGDPRRGWLVPGPCIGCDCPTRCTSEKAERRTVAHAI